MIAKNSLKDDEGVVQFDAVYINNIRHAEDFEVHSPVILNWSTARAF